MLCLDKEIIITLITAITTGVGGLFGYFKVRKNNIVKEEKEFRDELNTSIQQLQDNNMKLIEKIESIKEENSRIQEDNKIIKTKIEVIDKKIETLENSNNKNNE